MKTLISFLLLLILSSFSAMGAVLQGTSGSFPLDTSPPVPFSWIAPAVVVGLFGIYIIFRSIRSGGKASA